MLNLTTTIRARAASLCVAGAFLVAAAAPVAAQEWPQRQVTVVVPFTAGGTTDMFGRIFAQAMQQKYNQSFVVENKAGAGGTVGAAAVSVAAPDGYTLLVGTASTHAIAPYVYKRTGYDAAANFQPISLFAQLPNLLVVSPKMPVKTFAEFIEHVKANSGKLSYGSSGVGASNHLPGEMIQNLTGSKMTHVPYRSSGDIMNALAGGHIDLAFDNMTLAWPQAQGGTVRAIAVTSKDRSPTAPDVPAIAETFPGFDVATWHGLFAPAGTPRAIVDRSRPT
jgi:tripartite-type tricarboxylate transporter receptor subunit TctC